MEEDFLDAFDDPEGDVLTSDKDWKEIEEWAVDPEEDEFGVHSEASASCESLKVSRSDTGNSLSPAVVESSCADKNKKDKTTDTTLNECMAPAEIDSETAGSAGPPSEEEAVSFNPPPQSHEDDASEPLPHATSSTSSSAALPAAAPAPAVVEVAPEPAATEPSGVASSESHKLLIERPANEDPATCDARVDSAALTGVSVTAPVSAPPAAESPPVVPEVSAPPATADTPPVISPDLGGWVGGWGSAAAAATSSWGLGAIGKLAAGAVQEWSHSLGELKQTLAQVDYVSDDEDEVEDDRSSGSDRDGKEGGSGKDDRNNGQEGETVDGSSSTGGPDDDDDSPPADSTRTPPRPGEDRTVMFGEEEEIDSQSDPNMEQLAASAAKAFASLGGLLSGVAKGGWSVGQAIASKVEAAAKDMTAGVTDDVHQLKAAASSGLKGAAGGVGMIGAQLERGLETVGRTARVLIEEVVAGQYAGGGGGGGPAEGLLYNGVDGGGGDPETFEDFFVLYGGQQLCDEISDLSNECARTCNRSRSHLEPDQQERLDALSAEIGALFSEPLESVDLSAATAAVEGLSDDPVGEICWGQLQSRYAPVAYLLDHCCHRTTAPTTVSVNNSSSADASVTSHSEEEQTATTSSPCDGVVHANDQGTSAITDTAASQDTAAPSAAKGDEDEKKTLRFEMHDGRDAKRLAELATAQIQLLLDSGLSLAAPSRGVSEPPGTVSALSWPDSPRAQAILIRRQAATMERDLKAAVAAFRRASAAAASDLRGGPSGPQAGEDSEESTAHDAATATATAEASLSVGVAAEEEAAAEVLSAAERIALMRLQEGYRGMLACVLVRGLVADVAASAGSGASSGGGLIGGGEGALALG